MKASWKILSARELFFVLFAFAVLGYCIYQAKQYTSAATREAITTTYEMRINFRLQINMLLPNCYTYRCDYGFRVDDVSYSGRERCPQLIDDFIKAQSQGYSGSVPMANRTVYYDSANPSLNDLLKLSSVSDQYYRNAAGIIALGLVPVSFVAWILMATANEKRREHGIFVDTHGTVIYPNQINSNLGSDGLFNKDNDPQKPKAAGDGAPTYVPDSDPSHVLRELYLEVVKQIHPDRALDERDEALRERLMKEANAAFKRGDTNDLKKILQEYITIAAVR